MPSRLKRLRKASDCDITENESDLQTESVSKKKPKQSPKLPDAALANARTHDTTTCKAPTPPNSPVLVVNGAVVIPTDAVKESFDKVEKPAAGASKTTPNEKKLSKRDGKGSRNESTHEIGKTSAGDGQSKLSRRQRRKLKKLALESSPEVVGTVEKESPLAAEKVAAEKKRTKLTLKEKKRLKKLALASTQDTPAKSCPSNTEERTPGSAKKKRKRKTRIADDSPDIKQTLKDAQKREGEAEEPRHASKSKSSKSQKSAAKRLGASAAEETDPNKYKVFIGGISFSVDEESLTEHFEQCGSIRTINFQKDEKGRPKGVAFITFEDEEAVNNALACDGFDLDGRALTVQKAKAREKHQGVACTVDATKDSRNKEKREPSTQNEADHNDLKVFVGGIPFSADQHAIQSFFETCGTIASFNLQMDERGNSKGFAFIRFNTKEAVSKALEYNGTDYKGRALTVAMASQRRPSSKNSKGDTNETKKDGRGKAKGKGKGKGKGKDAKKGKGKGKRNAAQKVQKSDGATA